MASVGEGACSSDPQTQAVLGNWGTGGARHSVRAVVVNQDAWVGNRGGQGTVRPTCGFFCANGSLCYYLGFSSKSRPDIFWWMKVAWIGFIDPRTGTSLAESRLGRARHSVRAVPEPNTIYVNNVV